MTTPEPTTDVRQVAATIATALGETDIQPVTQIRRIVYRLGADVALAFLDEVIQIEAASGMMVGDGSRRRTPGGVYFYLVRGRVSAEDGAAIFPGFSRTKRKQMHRGDTQSAPVQQMVDPSELPNMNGEVTVKITLVGRPGPTKVMRDGSIMTSMQNAKAPTLPKGLPVPPTAPTIYTVYIAPKQWRKVADALRDPQDALILEGWPMYDPELEGIAVYVTNATTKVLQHQQKEAQPKG